MAMSLPTSSASDLPLQPDALRIRLGIHVVYAAFGLIGITTVACFAFWAWHGAGVQIQASDIVAVLGTVTGIVGTVVGAFFGISIAGSAKDQANAARTQAQHITESLLAQAQPADASSALEAAQNGGLATP